MNPETLLQREAKALAKLEAAKADYLKTSQAIREEIGRHLERIRTEAGLTRERMGVLIGVSNRNLLFGAECPSENGGRYYGVERLLEILTKYEWAIKVSAEMPAPLPRRKAGRPRKEPLLE